jgi:hypothetical protein
MASRVSDIDRKREKGIPYLSDLTTAERSNALRRVEENIAIIQMVQTSLNRRAGSYALRWNG